MCKSLRRDVYTLNRIIEQNGEESPLFQAFRSSHPSSFNKIYGRTVKQAAFKKAQREEAKRLLKEANQNKGVNNGI